MTKEQVQGIVRHIFTFIGGILVVKGFADETMISEVSGSLIALIGTVWSIINKSKSEKEKVEVEG